MFGLLTCSLLSFLHTLAHSAFGRSLLLQPFGFGKPSQRPHTFHSIVTCCDNASWPLFSSVCPSSSFRSLRRWAETPRLAAVGRRALLSLQRHQGVLLVLGTSGASHTCPTPMVVAPSSCRTSCAWSSSASPSSLWSSPSGKCIALEMLHLSERCTHA